VINPDSLLQSCTAGSDETAAPSGGTVALAESPNVLYIMAGDFSTENKKPP
jgi:hypothetical protein